MCLLAVRNLAFQYYLGKISASSLIDKGRGYHYLPWRLLRISVFSLTWLSEEKTCYLWFFRNFYETLQTTNTHITPPLTFLVP